MVFIRLAIRNVLRNKRRTFLVILIMAVGLGSMIFMDGVLRGITHELFRSSTDNFLGHGQIHAEGFRDQFEVSKTIHNVDSLTAKLKRSVEISDFTVRTQSFSMISSSVDSIPVMLVGVDTKTEKTVSQIHNYISEGEYLSFKDDPSLDQQIVIGNKLADRLEVSLGDRLVLTASRAGDGEMVQELFRVSGIFHSTIKELDESMSFININKAQAVLGIQDRIHQVAVRIHKKFNTEKQAEQFWSQFSVDRNESLGWQKLLPGLSAMLKMTSYNNLIMGTILFFVISLGFMNAVFMSIYERVFEFGVLKSIGTRPLQLMSLIFLEVLVVSLMSVFVGLVLGLGVNYYFSIQGLNWFSGVDMAEATMQNTVYPQLGVIQYTFFPSVVVLLSLMITIYPALYVYRLKPTKALKKTL